MINTYKVRIPIINQTIGCVVYDKGEEMEERFPKEMTGNGFNIGWYLGGSFENKEAYWMSFLRSRINYGIIAHEAKHTINRIFSDIQYDLDLRNDEMECYFLEWVVNWVVKKLKMQ